MSNESKPRQIAMEEVGKKLADVINEIVSGGIPIPFILATMDLIHHDLCNQHIGMTNQMHQLAKGNMPKLEVVPPPQNPAEN